MYLYASHKLFAQNSCCFNVSYESKLYFLSFLSWFEIFKAGSEENVVLLLGIVPLMTLAPVVGNRIGVDLTILIERTLGDRLLTWFTGLQLCPGIFIPERIFSITAHRCQGSMNWMKSYVIHSKNVLESINSSITSVTFECEIILWICSINILNCYSALHTSKSKACWC